MKVFLSAMWGALVGVVIGALWFRHQIDSGAIKVQFEPQHSRELEDISPKYKEDVERKLREIEDDHRSYRSPHERAIEIREMLGELLASPLTEHEAKRIVHRIGAEIELLGFDAEHIIKEFRPPPSHEDQEQ